MTSPIDRVVAEIDRAADEIVQFTTDLVRIPTVNPPGEAYADCARFIGNRLAAHGFDVEYFTADGVAEHSPAYPRVNVVGARRSGAGPVVHLNGHFDVVPAGAGWTVDPFGGTVRDGKIYGRGVCDMKAGIAAAVYAAEAIRRSGVDRRRHPRNQRHGRRGERRLRRRRLAGPIGSRGARQDRLRHHPRAAERRSHLHRPPRRLLGRADDARKNRARQHAVSRRQRHRRHGPCPRLHQDRAEAVARGAHHPDAGRARRRRLMPRSTSTASTADKPSAAFRRRASPTSAGRSSIGGFSSRKASSRPDTSSSSSSSGRSKPSRASATRCAT